jgi:hypothetical protein
LIIYRTTSGRVIDLWSFTPHHLAVASRLAAVIQQSAEAESRPPEEALRAELLRSLSLLGIGQDTPLDDALRAFVLDLAPRWLSSTERPPKGMTTLSWRAHLRSRIVAALGLEERGGKTTVANQLGADPSRGGRFLEALRRPTDPTEQSRADLLNQVEHLLDLRFLRLAVEEGLPPRVLDDLGRFSVDRGLKLSYREGRVLLATSRLVRFSGLGKGVDWSDLAWSLGTGETDEFAVEGLAKNIARLFGINAPAASCSVLPIPERYCSDPDVCTAFHFGFFDAHGHLPVVKDPAAVYTPRSPLEALNEPRFIPSDALGDAIGLASEGPPLPAPGQWLGSPHVKRELNRENIEAILQEARRVRRKWPLAVCVATGGAVAPSDSAGADLKDVASAIVKASPAPLKAQGQASPSFEYSSQRRLAAGLVSAAEKSAVGQDQAYGGKGWMDAHATSDKRSAAQAIQP